MILETAKLTSRSGNQYSVLQSKLGWPVRNDDFPFSLQTDLGSGHELVRIFSSWNFAVYIQQGSELTVRIYAG